MGFYNQGTFHPSENQLTIDFDGRYKIHSPVIFLFMAGRSLEPARSNQSSFVGLFRDPTSASAEIVQIQFAGKLAAELAWIREALLTGQLCRT